jgi:hypothetical protein
MACSLATGQDWMGQKTKAGVVVYLAGEGNYGLRQRITAWASHHDNYNLDNLLISNRAIDLDAPNASAEILRCIKEMDISERVVMVVVDTMNRHMSGDENSAKDIRALVNACSVVQAATGGAVMLVHHTGHGEGARNRARGSSNIKASLDFSFMVSREGEAVLISCDKMKDAREPDKLICKLQEVSLGWLDADGNLEPPAAVALLMDKMPESQPKVQPFNKGEQAAIAAYRNVAEIDGILNDDGTFGGISLEQWRPEFYKLFEGSYDAKKKAFKRARETMAERGEISEADGMVMLTGEFAAIDNSVFVKKLQVLRNLGDRGTRGTKGDN